MYLQRAHDAEARADELEIVLRAAWHYYPKDTPMSESMADVLAAAPGDRGEA